MTDQERITDLEVASEQGQKDHEAIFRSLEEIKVQLAMLQTNGGLTITFQDRRIKFAGSLPKLHIKPIYVALFLVSMGGNAGLLTKLFF